MLGSPMHSAWLLPLLNHMFQVSPTFNLGCFLKPLLIYLPRYNKALNPLPPSAGQTSLPASCCSPGPGECRGGDPGVHTGDCLALALAYVQEHAATLGAAAIAVTCLMVILHDTSNQGQLFTFVLDLLHAIITIP